MAISPVNRLGQGKPINESREPSVPPRIITGFGSMPTSFMASMAYWETKGTSFKTSFMLRYCSVILNSKVAPWYCATFCFTISSNLISYSFNLAVMWSLMIKVSSAFSAIPSMAIGCTNPSRCSVVSGDQESLGKAAKISPAIFIALTNLFLA